MASSRSAPPALLGEQVRGFKCSCGIMEAVDHVRAILFVLSQVEALELSGIGERERAFEKGKTFVSCFLNPVVHGPRILLGSLFNL